MTELDMMEAMLNRLFTSKRIEKINLYKYNTTVLIAHGFYGGTLSFEFDSETGKVTATEWEGSECEN